MSGRSKLRGVSRNRNSTALRPFGTVKSVLALVWLSPTPTMALSEMPTGELQGPMESLIAVDQVPGVWKV